MLCGISKGHLPTVAVMSITYVHNWCLRKNIDLFLKNCNLQAHFKMSQPLKNPRYVTFFDLSLFIKLHLLEKKKTMNIQ